MILGEKHGTSYLPCTVCQEHPEKSGRIFTFDRPAFIAILAFDPDT